MIEVQSNAEELRKKFERWARVAPEEVKKVLTEGALKVQREVQKAHLSGPRMAWGVGSETNATLAPWTGRLRNSIHYRVSAEGTGKFSAMVGTNVKYAKIHEFGGIIRAKNKPWLSFPSRRGITHFTAAGKLMKGGFAGAGRKVSWGWVQVKQVKIPARPFLRPSLERKRPEVFHDFAERIMQSYGK